MPICQSCKNQWTWGETIRRIFKFKCPYCGARQYESASTRKKGWLLIPFILLPILLNLWVDLLISLAIILVIILGAVILSIYPFVLKLSNDENF